MVHFRGSGNGGDAQERARLQYEADGAALDDDQRARILALATDVPRLWRDPTTPDRERKRMLRLILEDVTLIKGNELVVHVRFRGGATRTLTLPRPAPPGLYARRAAHTATLTRVLQLQHTLLACSCLQAPDPWWVGRCGPRTFLLLTHDVLQLVMLRDEYDAGVLADYLPERDWDYPRLRLRAHHRFPTLSACERYALLSAVVAVLFGTVAPGPRAMDPLVRLWQVLTPERREALAKRGRHWPQRIRQRLLDAMAGRASTIQRL